jgi:tRNA U34 5-carboxymethylaminomethyl modifying GTPase MnmE/TrmE
MLIDTLDAVKKLRAVNMPEMQAEAIASIISSIDDTVATKADIKTLETSLETKIDRLESKLEAKINKLEAKLETKIDVLEAKIDIQTSWLTRSAFVIIGLLVKIAFF